MGRGIIKFLFDIAQCSIMRVYTRLDNARDVTLVEPHVGGLASATLGTDVGKCGEGRGREGVSTVVRVPTLVLVVTHPHTSTLTLVPIELSLLHAR